MAKFRLGENQLFWDGNLEVPCPACNTSNFKTSDRSTESCKNCHRWYNWRAIAYRMFHEYAEASVTEASRQGPDVESQIWTPSEELKRMRPRARGPSGRYHKGPRPEAS